MATTHAMSREDLWATTVSAFAKSESLWQAGAIKKLADTPGYKAARDLFLGNHPPSDLVVQRLLRRAAIEAKLIRASA